MTFNSVVRRSGVRPICQDGRPLRIALLVQEWDDAVAGREWRVHQARRLIALYVVTEEGDRKTVSLVIDRTKGGGYRQIEDVARQPVLRERMLIEALNELRRMQAKYKSLRELAGVFSEFRMVDEAHSRKAG